MKTRTKWYTVFILIVSSSLLASAQSNSSKSAGLDTVYWSNSISTAALRFDSADYFNRQMMEMLQQLQDEKYFEKKKQKHKCDADCPHRKKDTVEQNREQFIPE